MILQIPLLAQRPIARICLNSSADSLPLHSIPSALKLILIKCNNQSEFKDHIWKEKHLSPLGASGSSIWNIKERFLGITQRSHWNDQCCDVDIKHFGTLPKLNYSPESKAKLLFQGCLIVMEQLLEFQRLGPSSPKPFIFLRCKKKKKKLHPKMQIVFHEHSLLQFLLIHAFIYLLIKTSTAVYKTGEVHTRMRESWLS